MAVPCETGLQQQGPHPKAVLLGCLTDTQFCLPCLHNQVQWTQHVAQRNKPTWFTSELKSCF